MKVETFYGSRLIDKQTSGVIPPLSPSIEEFLKEIGKGLDSDI